MSTHREPSQVIVGTDTPVTAALSQSTHTARPMHHNDATWQLISSLIELVIAAHRAAQHAGTA